MTNKDLSSNLFDGVVLPDGANDCGTVYFKIAACSTATIAANGSFPGATGGEAAINDIIISGTSVSGAIPTLAAPTASIPGGSEIYGNTSVSLSCSTSDTAQIKYKINGGEATDYTGKFIPFKNISDKTVTIQTWAEQSGYTASETAIYTYTSTKDEITSFDFTDGKYPEYVNGAVTADSGVYPAGRITASLDGESQYTPLYSTDEKAISIAPDDTYTWQEDGYWQIETSTAGYENVYLCTDAFSSKKGPASMTLQYSTDGKNYVSLLYDNPLPAGKNGTYYSNY